MGNLSTDRAQERVEEMDEQQRAYEAEALKAAMGQAGWSATDLIRQSGVSKNTVTRALRGGSVHPGTLRKLRDALGIQPTTVAADRYDDDVEMIGLAVKVWLDDLSPQERPAAVAALFHAVVAYRDRDTGQ